MTKSIANYATATRMINEVNGVNRVVHTSKPPGMIEREQGDSLPRRYFLSEETPSWDF
jgi:hypothetical protein